MSNILKIKVFSFNIKVFISFLLLGLFLLTILFLLIVPKMQNEKYSLVEKQIEQIISLTKEQIIIASKSIKMQSELEIQKTKYEIQNSILKIKNNIENSINLEKNKIEKIIKESDLKNKCNINLIPYNHNTIFDTWKHIKINDKKRSFNKQISTYEIKTKLNYKNFALNTICKSSIFNINHSKFEKDIKQNIQNSFNLSSAIHKGKIYLIWINKKYKDDNNPLFTKDEVLKKDKYTISNISNVNEIYTGELSTKQIIQNSGKEAISHTVNNKEALTWINILKESPHSYFMLITSVYKEDFDDHIDSAFWKILPTSLLALLLAIAVGFIIFKRLFKNINILSKTAKQINQGNIKIRSNVKGKDDIGNLGITFDSMLDSLQYNIKNLDLEVQKKTKQLQILVDEKDLLLKEVHHRVKNNLALTISLIKLQQYEIKDSKTKKVLKDIQERIYTMELVHRKLYESSNLNLINTKEYIQNLVLDIKRTYSNKHEVSIIFDIEDINLDIETIMPCALILNEIITNSFKYAFIDNKNPILTIIFKKEKDKYIISIKDNGKGIPKDIDINNSNTLGLKLISSISEVQLKGKFKYLYDEGSIFIINF